MPYLCCSPPLTQAWCLVKVHTGFCAWLTEWLALELPNPHDVPSHNYDAHRGLCFVFLRFSQRRDAKSICMSGNIWLLAPPIAWLIQVCLKISTLLAEKQSVYFQPSMTDRIISSFTSTSALMPCFEGDA